MEAQSNRIMEEKKTIITVGRQFGSGGLAVAKELGKILGIPVYDGELLEEAARKSGLAEHLFSSSDEKRRYWNFGGGLDDAFIFKYQSEAIRALAAEGSAIFVGRCSNYVLRDMDCTDIFICAPFELRVKEVAEREGISEAEAERKVNRIDRERADYYNFFTLNKWGAAAEYNLCIDASILGIRGTAELICDFLGRK